jgi:hypothetical protein
MAVLSETKEASPQFVETATAGILRFAQNDRARGFLPSLLTTAFAVASLRWGKTYNVGHG